MLREGGDESRIILTSVGAATVGVLSLFLFLVIPSLSVAIKFSRSKESRIMIE